ncbi:MAG: hypothetical protein JXA09_05225 [Anaerolineae bacterium]|nr:hypothetical protein [Anaerolineae bacterium]
MSDQQKHSVSATPNGSRRHKASRFSHLWKRTCWLPLLLYLIALIPIWVIHFPPSQDFPKHLLEAYYLSDPGDAFVVKWRPIPYWTIILILYALSRIMPWLAAGKVLLSISVFAFLAGGHYFLTRVDPRLGLWSWILGIIAYNGFFMSGVLNYYLALGLSMFVIGYWYARQKGRFGWASWGMLALCTLLYLTHVIPFLMALACTLLSILVRSVQRRTRLLSPLLWEAALCFLPGVLLLLAYLVGRTEPGEVGPFPSLAERVFVSIQTMLIYSVEAIPQTVSPAVLQNGIRLAMLGLALGSRVWSWLRSRKASEPSQPASPVHNRRGEWFVLFGFSFLLWLLVPTGVSDFLRFDQRLFPYVLFWGLCLLGPLSPQLRPFVRSTLAVSAGVCLALTTLVFVRADWVFRGHAAQLSALPEGGTVMSLTEYYPSSPRSTLEMLTPRNPVPYALDCYYILQKGGVYPAVFDVGPIRVRDIPVVSRRWELGQADRFDFSCREFIAEEMDALSQHYTLVFLWGQPCTDAGDLLGTYGYQWLLTHQQMSVWARGDVLD